MAQERLMQAIGRIERTLSRLESAEFRAPQSGGHNELAEKHQKLQGEVRASISDLDSLLSQVNN